MELELKPLNILIGVNGSGKSNFINFFKFMNKILEQDLQLYVAQKGTSESFLHFGSKRTREINIKLFFYPNGYDLKLVPTSDGKLVFEYEWISYQRPEYDSPVSYSTGVKPGDTESHLKESKQPVADHVRRYLDSWKIYHFHDTSDTARVKAVSNINDNIRLHPNGDNLAAFLFSIKETESYQSIIKTIQRVAPFFHDFIFHGPVINLRL